VVLTKRSETHFFTMGVPIMEPQLGELPVLSFKKDAFKLNADNRAMLATIALKMKAVPDASVTIIAYPDACEHKARMLSDRVNNIKKYLIEKEGIAVDRISTNFEVGGGDRNTVEIKAN
jgi:outer membrane protein OmpA-like peptidoglycan-associated protein